MASRLSFSGLVFLLALFSACSVTEQQRPVETFDKIQVVHKVVIKDRSGINLGSGSAVAVSIKQNIASSYELTCLTARHVADVVFHEYELFIDIDSIDYKVTSADLHPSLDIALIRCTLIRPVSIVTNISTNINKEDRITAYGFPGGIGLSITEGVVSYYDDKDATWMCSACIFPGSSGGAVFLGDRLIGISVSSYVVHNQIASHLHFFIPLQLEWLKEKGVSWDMTRN